MPAEPFIVYDPPYGGQAIRGRRTADAWAKVSAFLESCTDALPSRPTSLRLALYESDGPAAAEWLLPAGEQATTHFGPGVRRAWTTGARQDYRVEWDLAPDSLHQALALLAGWEPMPKTDFGPAALTIGYRFRWVELATRVVLPGQRVDQRAHPLQAESDLLVTLGNRSSAILNARLPFTEPSPQFVAYLKGLLPRLPIKLNPARLRHWVPTKKGGGLGYRPLRIALELGKS